MLLQWENTVRDSNNVFYKHQGIDDQYLKEKHISQNMPKLYFSTSILVKSSI